MSVSPTAPDGIGTEMDLGLLLEGSTSLQESGDPAKETLKRPAFDAPELSTPEKRLKLDELAQL